MYVGMDFMDDWLRRKQNYFSFIEFVTAVHVPEILYEIN